MKSLNSANRCVNNPLQLFSLQGKTALVTGGGSGLGAMIARALAAAGAFVWVVSRGSNKQMSGAVIDDIRAQGGRAEECFADVTDEDDINKMLARVGDIDILVNAAGINPRLAADDLTLADWQKTIAVNLTAPYYLTQLAAAGMRRNGWGRVLNIASLQSSRAFANGIPYGASKGGVVQLTRAQARAYAKDGVLVNAVAPGFFHTRMTEVLFKDEAKARQLAGKTMLGRNGEAGDVFGVVVFLCGDANSYITGQTIYLDGGFSAQ